MQEFLAPSEVSGYVSLNELESSPTLLYFISYLETCFLNFCRKKCLNNPSTLPAFIANSIGMIIIINLLGKDAQ